LSRDQAEDASRRNEDRGEKPAVGDVPACDPNKEGEADDGPAKKRREIGQATEGAATSMTLGG
jgi:hypothetical protein